MRLEEPIILDTPITVCDKTLRVLVACTRYTSTLPGELARVLGGEAYFSLVNLELATQAGLRALITAHLESYLAAQRGATISRIRGLDPILYIIGRRNIQEALKANRLEDGATILFIMTSHDDKLLNQARTLIETVECNIPVKGSIELGKIVVFPLEARVYKSISSSKEATE